jgi:hypothetical protein
MAGAAKVPAMRVRREIEFVMGVLLLDVARWPGFSIVVRVGSGLMSHAWTSERARRSEASRSKASA